MIKMAIAKLVPVKIAIVAATATAAAGGVALAANAGVLPNQGKPHAPQSSHSPQSGEQPGKPSAHPTGKGNSPTAPPAALQGLCTAYANVVDNPGKALENPAFGRLVEAAGGKANVAAFCAALPTKGPQGNGQPTDKPGGKPSDHPTNKPTDNPGGQPTDKPGNAPTAHPTGQGR